RGKQTMVLHPAPIVDLEVEVSQKKGREQFKLEVTWRKEVIVHDMADLRILSSVPPEATASLEPVEATPAVAAANGSASAD
ncbi:MAG: amphi-Trp domain-containing protein, partial [Planctomycetia bacterium]